MHCPRLFVCLSVSKITQKRVHGFGWNIACRQMSEHGRTDKLLSPIRIIVRMPEPDCLLCYRISHATRNFTSGKSDVYILVGAASRGLKMVLRPTTAAMRVLQWLHSLRQWAVETPMSEVHVIHQVLFQFVILKQRTTLRNITSDNETLDFGLSYKLESKHDWRNLTNANALTCRHPTYHGHPKQQWVAHVTEKRQYWQLEGETCSATADH